MSKGVCSCLNHEMSYFSQKPLSLRERVSQGCLRGETEANIMLNQEVPLERDNMFQYHLPSGYRDLSAMLEAVHTPQHCVFPDILVEPTPEGSSQVDVTRLWAIRVQSHIDVVLLHLHLDSLINSGPERGVDVHHLSQWAVNFEA